MAFQSVTRTTAANGTFAVPAVTAGADGQVIVHNNTQAGLMGSMRVVRSADSIDTTFALDLEPGEVFVFRNETAATIYTYTGSFKHTAVKAHVPYEYDTSKDEAYNATGQGASTRLAAINVQQI